MKNNSNSQAKLRKSLEDAGKVSVSDYILIDTKKKLIKIKKEKGFRRLGDAIDEALKDFPLGENDE
jgi:hypothetical protein